MLKKRVATSMAALLLAGAMLFPAGGIMVKAAAPESSGASSASSGQASAPGSPKHCRYHVGGDRMALVLLADLSKQSVKGLNERYPQQTPWQIAKQTNNLDTLKKSYLEKQQQCIRSLQESGHLTQADSTQLYNAIAERVAKIDGIKIVTVGHVHL
ncbi:hypothetical protein [Ethanoligenens sp.]|uniref:hypothetical protein n=1 Tax=Ethanoligenens sp. TaxID=2099655 RepID=UPI0039EA759B